MRDSIDNNKFRLFGPYDKWLRLDGNTITHKSSEFYSRYIFEKNEDARSVFNSLNKRYEPTVGGPIVTYTFDKDGKISFENTGINMKKVENATQQITSILNFALTLYQGAYRLTEVRPWWCSSRFRNFADFNKTVRFADIKNKWKFNQFVTTEEWATEKTFFAERNEFKPKVPPKLQQYKPVYRQPTAQSYRPPPKPIPQVSKDDAIRLLDDLLRNE